MKRKRNLIRHCGYCFAPLEGRSDKRFCSLYCKNHYHQTVKEHQDAYDIPDVELDFFVLCTAYFKEENKHPLDPELLLKYDWCDVIKLMAVKYGKLYGAAYFHCFKLKYLANKDEGIRIDYLMNATYDGNYIALSLSDYLILKQFQAKGLV